MNKISNLIAILTCFQSLNSFAGILKNFEQEGFNHQTISSMSSYGMAVPVITGLKTALPTGWQVFIHEKVELPKSVNWNLGDPWLKVFSNLADKENISVLVDWDKKSIFIRPLAVALEEKEIKDKLILAASTPIPKTNNSKAVSYNINTKDKSSSVATPVVDFKAKVDGVDVELKISKTEVDTPVPTVPAVVSNPSEDQLKDKLNRNFEIKPEYKSSPAFEFKGPVAFNRASVRDVAQIVANKYNVPLNWTTSDQKFLGPVTILGASLEQDVLLINKALGVYNPLQIVQKQGALWSSVNGKTKGTICCSVPVKLKASNTFVSNPGQDLRQTLDLYLASLGYSLDWKVDATFESQSKIQLKKDTLAEVLAEILPPLGLSAMIDNKSKTVIVVAN